MRDRASSLIAPIPKGMICTLYDTRKLVLSLNPSMFESPGCWTYNLRP